MVIFVESDHLPKTGLTIKPANDVTEDRNAPLGTITNPCHCGHKDLSIAIIEN